MMEEKICFEFPMTENIRHLLRIEYLFNKFELSKKVDTHWSNDYSLYILFDIMDYAARAELKVRLLQDLEKLKNILKYSSDDQKINIDNIVDNIKSLQVIKNKFAQNIRDNEWLMSIKHKMRSFGGVSPIDYPSYFLWQNLSYEDRLDYLNKWSDPLSPTRDAVISLLKALRSNFILEEHTAFNGVFKQGNVNRNISLLQIILDKGLGLNPELSANYHLMHIRFIKSDFFHNRGLKIEDDINFELKVCSFKDAIVE